MSGTSTFQSRPVALHQAEQRGAVSGIPIGKYLIDRLMQYGVGDVFGVPGDYVYQFYDLLDESPINVISCTREDTAGYAADAYARMKGIGAVCVTYCAGGLSVCNAIAEAYAEKSPVVLISGSPGVGERFNNPLLHHRVKDFDTQSEVFRRLCVADTVLTDSYTAFREIDRVLEAVERYRRPGYIELPRDMVAMVPEGSYTPSTTESRSDPDALREAVAEASRRISEARRPVIIAGVEIHRFGLQDKLVAIAEDAGIPITATMLGKSVVGEQHPLFAGIYEGAMGRDEVTTLVEQSDCVIILGAFMSDINLGIFTADLNPTRCIYATSEALRISHHHFHGVLFRDFVEGLVAARLHAMPQTLPPRQGFTEDRYEVRPEEPIRVRRLIARLNESLDASTVVVADVGDALYASSDLAIRRQTEFISPAYYSSMGFSVPAALGINVARPDLRPIVLVGDGAFQMTGTELSTALRLKFSPIVVVLDNQGYGSERIFHDGEHACNEIRPWQYAKLPELIGGGRGFEVHTEGDFDHALREARDDPKTLSLIHVHLAENDCSRALQRLATKMASRV